ncbi:universal stress protein [Natronosporangium hydrolyticum]|uniref:Universal stress protein n=1 Tax=Natronosporangium hydrolyticum TaxID=2811111 RepID=A0A895YFY8_9ACTN|nr:universal stress protein [Natronosporangium hydrolyticum]QSB15005.1 universal stress protein [Natronosporangium hydrolyticum]
MRLPSGESGQAPAVLVGYDGSRNARAALGWALREAERRRAPVALIYVYEWGISPGPVPAGSTWPDRSARREAEAAVAEVVGEAQARHPAVPLTGTVIDGLVVPHLRGLSEQAQLLVLGDRGLGGFPELRAGSVATELTARARCPVVVVRGCAPAPRPVVVGVDDSPDSSVAIRFAYEYAAAHQIGVVAARACQPPPVPRRPDSSPAHPPRGHETEQRRLAEQLLQSWADRYPAVDTELRCWSGAPAPTLISASTQAQLVVVGAHGHRGAGAGPIGPTAGHLIQHAHCPVAVVRWSESVHQPRPRTSAESAGRRGLTAQLR